MLASHFASSQGQSLGTKSSAHVSSWTVSLETQSMNEKRSLIPSLRPKFPSVIWGTHPKRGCSLLPGSVFLNHVLFFCWALWHRRTLSDTALFSLASPQTFMGSWRRSLPWNFPEISFQFSFKLRHFHKFSVDSPGRSHLEFDRGALGQC